jgi:SAM-dependent methyltransferase
MSEQPKFRLQFDGICPICEKPATFIASAPWLRGSLMCASCHNGSTPRERALALVLNEQIPNWRTLSIHESSPVNRGISAKIRMEGQFHTPTQFYPDLGLGQYRDGFRNEDLQRLTFSDEQFDLFISLDVLEHIPEPELSIKEIWRTLKFGGIMLCTFPVRKQQVDAMDYRAKFNDDGSVTHLKEPEYHGNPIDSKGALVTVDYGYDIHKEIALWAPFDVRVYRFDDKTHGILGEYTDVFYCKKRA